jgi:hypothetical protein
MFPGKETDASETQLFDFYSPLIGCVILKIMDRYTYIKHLCNSIAQAVQPNGRSNSRIFLLGRKLGKHLFLGHFSRQKTSLYFPT